ncbi:type I glyceraldehyde-3-phosphate dehydrogenase [bacterium]|nr:type I glyceraldehyde-3-phosphate dehydrogenase [bacterium]
MKKRIAINGFGRIGRLTFRRLIGRDDIDIVGINDLTEPATLAHLLKYDSAHGRFNGTVAVEGSDLIVNGDRIRVSAIKDPAHLPWKELGAEVVLECTGRFTSQEELQLHLNAGAGRVVLSAPAKGGGVKTIVLGVNDSELSPNDRMVSNASCTTNCLAPMAKVLNDQFGIVQGYMTTVHAFTADQRLQDAPHSDLRRARAASVSIIPTSTGAAKAVGLVLPELQGKLDGIAMRVPTITGSVTDLTAVLAQPASAADINAAMRQASEQGLKGLMEYCEDPIVSADVVGSPYSCIFDPALTSAKGSLVKVVGWYDNEAGYSARLADLCVRMASL